MICVWLSSMFMRSHLLSPILGCILSLYSSPVSPGKSQAEILVWGPRATVGGFVAEGNIAGLK